MDEKVWLAELTTLLEKHRNKESAKPMQNYMKDHFPFFGIKSPGR